MREFLTFLTALLVLAIAQSLTAVLGVALLILALMGIVTHPRRTLALVAALGLLGVAVQRPAACAAALGAVGVAAVVASRLRRHAVQAQPSPTPLLPPPAP